MESNELLAHISDDMRLQTMQEHEDGVADLCSAFITRTLGPNWSDLGSLLGHTHDLGKKNVDWQRYLRRARGLEEGTPISVPHSATGALLAQNALPKRLARITSYCISSHHRGLYDYQNLHNRLWSAEEHRIYSSICSQPLKSSAKDEPWAIKLEEQLKSLTESLEGRKDLQMLIRMIFSCLVDADARDTERFFEPNKDEQRATLSEQYDRNNWSRLREQLRAYTEALEPNSEINRARAHFLAQCRRHGQEAPRGIYSLFLPTGGGKTLSSVAWALETAERHNLEHIIIVIPFTSIITQTAQKLIEIFGEDCILEHHSDIDVKASLEQIELANQDRETAERIIKSSNNTARESDKEEAEHSRIKLLADNWQDIPIIVTTNVQFFESLFANRPSKCRKVHSIANSVLIFDECQSFPIEQLNPMLRTIESLSRSFGTQTLLCTATQPIFDEEIKSSGPKNKFYNIKKSITEVVPYDESIFRHFDRVRYQLNVIRCTSSELARRLKQHKSVLCVVNTRRDAGLIFEAMKDEDGKTQKRLIHLSRMMCSEHLSDRIATIKERLKLGQPTIVISTQLIEAGVDLDFPVVYRAHAGLDSIIQAGGRCNREGKLPNQGEVYVFDLTDGSKAFPALAKGQYATEETRQTENFDLRNPEISKIYYRKLYHRHSVFDKGNTLQHLWHIDVTKPIKLNFESAQKAFRLIDDEGNFDVFVPYTNGEHIIKKITSSQWLEREELRKLQRLRVGLRQRDLLELIRRGSVSAVNFWGKEKTPILVLTDKKSYSEEVGVVMANHYLEEPQIAST